MRGLALFSASVALAGCSLFLSTADFAGQGDPADAASQSDAGDAAVTTIDTVDGGDGATPSEGGSAVSFCASLNPKPKFCADFDGTGPVEEGWNGINVDPAGVGSVTRDALGRDRSSMLAKMTAPMGCSYARLAKTFATTGRNLTVSYSFRPSNPFSDAAFSLISLEGTGSGGGCAILYHFNVTNGAYLHMQYGSPQVDQTYDWAVTPKTDAWSKIETTIDANGGLVIKVDGSEAINRNVGDACKPGAEVYFAPGFHCEGDVHEARYDDVIVDYP